MIVSLLSVVTVSMPSKAHRVELRIPVADEEAESGNSLAEVISGLRAACVVQTVVGCAVTPGYELAECGSTS